MQSENNTLPLNTTPEIGNQVQPYSHFPQQSNSKTHFLIAACVIIGLMAFGFGGYYLGKQSSNTNKLTVEQSLSTPTALVSPSQAPHPTSIVDSQAGSLPSGWLYKSNGECGVKFPIPPKVPPYYQPFDPNTPPSVTDDKRRGRFWDFPRGSVYPNLLSKLRVENEEYQQAPGMYTSLNEATYGSGNIPYAVVVSCLPNTNNLNNLSMLNLLKTKLQSYNQDTSIIKGMQATSYTIKSSNEVSRWGKKVIDLSISEYYSDYLPPEYYSHHLNSKPFTAIVEYSIFATPKFLYEVRVMRDPSIDSSVQDAAKEIFQNLSFE